MNTTLKIRCINLGTTIEVEPSTSLDQLAHQLEPQLGFRPICAMVNNKVESLRLELYKPKTIEFLSCNHPSGARTYIRSLCMVLYLAVHRLWPEARLNIGMHMAQGYLFHIKGQTITPEMLEMIRREMRKIIDADLPFERFEEPTEDVIKVFEKQGLQDKVRLLRTYSEPYKTYYLLDGVADSYYGSLVMRTSDLTVHDVQICHEGLLLLGPDSDNPDLPAQPVTLHKLYNAYTDYVHFNHVIGVSDVGELNDVVLSKHVSQLINVAEAMHEKSIARISDEIARRYRQGGARIVLIAGPSSSGKTTTTKRLAVQLMTQLLRPQMISLDDYFVDRHYTPRDADGDYDYESIYALDLKRFNDDLNRILAGEEVILPKYNFETGRSTNGGHHIQLKEGGILLIEGIHGLNPELTANIPEQMKFRVYVSAITTLSIDDHNWIPTTDNRLLRRIIRDHKYRGTSACDTIRRWPSVRRGEERWIFPYQENADATFNSSLLFELGVMKDYADKILSNVPHDVPEYSEAYRLRKFLSYFKSIDDKAVPPTSLLREFLGGSSFRY